ncbi:uncharacterized protein PV09_04432 [Verruconis gallopava]|uniref:AT hook domain-containing protein n=1 Tax=Verruconis gallopava TaxID=253628 RepID=A0A0D2ACR2_9PEZI|nr:uncharacterized protein PV09_04432 [Verruconis gallopava]KIW04698.1 hypothetical protein PV09_04432 [Verruconis gallopava]
METSPSRKRLDLPRRSNRLKVKCHNKGSNYGRCQTTAHMSLLSPHKSNLMGPSKSPKEPKSAIFELPPNLKADDVDLSPLDLKILLKKQDWLRKNSVALPDQHASTKKIAEATLVFGQEEAGTAVCISEKGILLTCSHCVAETESELELERLHYMLFASGQIIQAKCIAWDARRDLALLKIVAAQAPHDSSFPAAQVSSQEPKIRQRILCVGHPGSTDLEASLPGLKTNYDTLYVSTGNFHGYAQGQNLHDNFEIGALQHDCWTYWGHSGAPLAHRKTGKLVGLHSSWDETTGMRRGIPLDAIHAFMEENSHYLS